MLRIYLAGSTAEVDYRTYCEENFSKKLDLRNPLKNEEEILGFDVLEILSGERSLTNKEVSKIVVYDKKIIESCDIIVAFIRKYSAGTCMEILHAWNNQIPVYIIDPSKNFRNDVWIKYHTTKAFDSIDDCFKYIVLSIE